jgi:hypothetical protein
MALDRDTVVSTLRAVAERYPRAYQNCHRDENRHPEAWDFAILGLQALTRIDAQYGLNGKRGDRNNLSSDAFAYGTGRAVQIIDFLIGAGEHGNNLDKIAFIDVTAASQPLGGIWVDPFSRKTAVDYESAPPPVQTPAQTRLGASCFWLVGGYEKFPVQLAENLRWYREVMGADFVRGFVVLGGDLFSGHDPWSIVGTHWRQRGFVGLLQEVAGYVFREHQLKVAWTLVGGRAQVDGPVAQTELVDAVAEALTPVLNMVEYFEIWNEYKVNRGERHEMSAMARQLRAKLPAGFPIALSSPNSVMGGNASYADVDKEIYSMYGGDSGANLITIHPTRPDPIWNAETVHAVVSANSFNLAIGEPRGPGASAGGDVDNPAILAGDYQSAIRAQAKGYVFHSKSGVWGGHCDPAFPAQNTVANVWEHRNAAQIAAALKQLRQTGTTPTIPVGDPMHPYPDEPTWWGPEFEAKVAALYKQAGQDLPADVFAAGRWFARTGWDIAAGLTKEASAAKHLAGLAKQLGVER